MRGQSFVLSMLYLPLKEEVSRSFSEILDAVGLLGASSLFIPLGIIFCFKIFTVCLNNQNVLFNIFLTIFE